MAFSGGRSGSGLPRFKVFKRDGFRCIYCGQSSIEDGVKLHIDHIKPVSKGGTSKLENLVTACAGCNGEKRRSC
jgi:5-methylcytosine-specific restriction endonuclease McrA